MTVYYNVISTGLNIDHEFTYRPSEVNIGIYNVTKSVNQSIN